MSNQGFICTYQNIGAVYSNTMSFWKVYRVSHSQANFDRHYLYGMLMLATQNNQHKTLMKYEDLKVNILAWIELKEENEYNGSKKLRLEQLEQMATAPYSTRNVGGIATYINKIQVIVQALETLDPGEYRNVRKKKLLFTNVRTASGVAHLIQKCRDNECMS